MNFFLPGNKNLTTLSYLLAILPISLLTGSLIINLITVIISIIFIFELFIKKKLNFLNDWSFYLFLFLWLSFLVNLIFSQDSSLGIFRVAGFIRFILLAQAIRYIFLINDTKYKELILKSWLLIFALVNLDLIYEYFSGKNILGYKSNLEGRLASFLDDELKIGGYYFGFCLLSLATIYSNFKKDYKIIFGFAILFLTISFLIGERSNFIKVLFSVLLILIIYFNEHKLKLLSLSLLCIIIFISIIYKNENLKYRYILQWNENNITENTYFIHYKTAILVFKKYPVFGSGIKNFRVEVKKIIKEELQDDENYNNWQVITTHPHQINFEILAETGIFGFTCFFLFFLITFIFSFKKILRNNDIFLTVSTIFCLIYINPLLPSGSFFTTYGATIFWTNYGVMISYLSSKKKLINLVR
tara:strand:- start:3816 stop:5060 length:1245 start_codon:yes stop_codon:yes gene_type:complete